LASKTDRSVACPGVQEGGVEDIEEEEPDGSEEEIRETMFTFEAFEIVSAFQSICYAHWIESQ